MNKASRDTGTVGRTARRPHNPHVIISLTIQLRLGLCDLWLYFYGRTLGRRREDIFTLQRPETRSLYSAQSRDKKMQIATFLSTPKIQKKCPLIWFQSWKQFVRNFVTMMWHKIVLSRFGISKRDLLVQRSHETYFCWFFTQDFLIFSERFGVHDVNFDDPSRPRTPKESAKVLTEIFNTRKIPDRFLD